MITLHEIIYLVLLHTRDPRYHQIARNVPGIIAFVRDSFVGSEVVTAVVMNVAVAWDIVPCSPYENQQVPLQLLLAGFLLC
jgi:hypothetical protein